MNKGNGMDKSDRLVMAQTIWGESRGETKEGQYAIAHVIKNRLDSKKWFSTDTLEGVCKKKWQFSCWNEGDPNKEKMEQLTHGDIKDFVDIANNVLDGLHDSNVGKATHYYADYISEPKWAEGKTPITKIGVHHFYEDID